MIPQSCGFSRWVQADKILTSVSPCNLGLSAFEVLEVVHNTILHASVFMPNCFQVVFMLLFLPKCSRRRVEVITGGSSTENIQKKPCWWKTNVLWSNITLFQGPHFTWFILGKSLMLSSFFRSSSCHCLRYAWRSTLPFPNESHKWKTITVRTFAMEIHSHAVSWPSCSFRQHLSTCLTVPEAPEWSVDWLAVHT